MLFIGHFFPQNWVEIFFNYKSNFDKRNVFTDLVETAILYKSKCNENPWFSS